MSEPDFYACATLGFRQWHLSLDDAEGVAFLEGLLKYGFHQPHHRWDLGRPNRAECLHARFSPRSVPEGHGGVPGDRLLVRVLRPRLQEGVQQRHHGS